MYIVTWEEPKVDEWSTDEYTLGYDLQCQMFEGKESKERALEFIECQLRFNGGARYIKLYKAEELGLSVDVSIRE